MSDATNNVDANIDRMLKAGALPRLSKADAFLQRDMRKTMQDIMTSCLKQGADMCMEESTMADTARLDWLATESDVRNLRAVVDAAMEASEQS